MAVYASAGTPHPELYPSWVVRKVGVPVLIEADWPEASIGSKYGIVNVGTGDGGNIFRDPQHFYGGFGSCFCTTGNHIGDMAGVQVFTPFTVTGLIAFEQRWIPSPNSDWNFGLEWDVRARLRYEGATGQWQYESDTGVFSYFDTPLSVYKPSLADTGDRWGWARLVVDLEAQRYVSFEAAGQNHMQHYRDLSQVRLVDAGLGVGAYDLKFFGVATTRAASNETSYTTDWCVSKQD